MKCCREKKKINFQPEKWEQGIGEPCISCKQRLETQDCVSLCRCYLFCHEQCFLREFSPFISDHQEIRCVRCGEEVKLEMFYIYKWECNKQPINIVSIVISSIALLAIMILTIMKVFEGSYGWPIFIVGLILHIGAIIFAQRRKYIYLDKVHVKSTNLLGTLENAGDLKQMSNNYQNDLKRSHDALDSATSSNNDQFDIQ